MLRHPPSSLALALLLVLVPPAAAQDLDRALAAARADLVKELEGLAKQAFKSKLFRERDRTYALILGVAPDHAAARRALRYRRSRDGRWERRSYREPRNGAEDGLADFAASRQRILGDHAAGVLRLLEAHAEGLEPAKRATILEALVALAPEHEAVRTAAGDVSHEGRWVLRETRVALRRRGEIVALARKAIAGVEKPREDQVAASESAWGVPFSVAFRTDNVRVVGSTSAAEAAAVARISEAVGPFLRELFEVSTRHRPDYRIYLLGDPEQRKPLLENHPDMTPEVRRFVENLLAAWIPGHDHLVEWGERAELRLDGSARQTIGTFLIDGFGRVDRLGWTWEGFGLYLAHHLTGTRLTWFVQPSRYERGDDDLRARLMDRKTDWLAEAAHLVAEGKAPDLRGLLGRTVNDMGPRDTLMAHALAAHLCEAHPEGVVPVLRAVGRGGDPVIAIESALTTTLPIFEQRFRRWLGEVARAGG